MGEVLGVKSQGSREEMTYRLYQALKHPRVAPQSHFSMRYLKEDGD